MKKYIIFLLIIKIIIINILGCDNSNKGIGHSKTHPKWLIYNLASEPVTLNYVASSDAYASSVFGYVFEGMIDIDKNLEIIPSLAKNYEISDDNLTIQFNLRDDIYFHDGHKLTSEDVRFTYDMIMNPKNKALNKRTLFLDVESVETPDDYTVIVKYTNPNVSAILNWAMAIMPKHVYENVDFLDNPYNRMPIGTGAFKMKEWKSRQYIDLERVDNHWKINPEIERVRFKFVNNPDVAYKSYIKGDLDIIGLTAEQWEREKDNPDLTNKSSFYTYDPLSFAYIGWNMSGSNPFFNDKKVRQAMAYALDLDTFIERILYNNANRTTGPYHPNSWAYDKSLPPYEFNIDKAKALLKEAGWVDTDKDSILDKIIDGEKVNFSFEVLYGDGSSTGELLLLVYQQDLKKIGIQLNLHKIEWSSFTQRINNKDFDAVLLAWSLSIDPDPTDIFHSRNIETGLNYISYKNEEVDRLSESNTLIFDREKRTEVLKEIHRLMYEDQPYLFLWSSKALIYVHNRFDNIQTSSTGISGFFPGIFGWTIKETY